MCRSNLSASDLMCAPKVESAQIGEQSEAPPSSAAMKSSAKVEALIQLLTAVRDKDPTEKSVVFSQFSQMLTCLQGPLTDAGFHFVRLDGSMTVKKRQVALTAFHSKDLTSPTVFLLSLKAAGVGLNLVAASRVFMLDPWWNPAVEEQAMDRVHRLGQTRDVEVVRLVVSDSIEERILELQDRKRQLATFAFEKRSAAQQRLTRIQDVQLLMHL
jgi:SWI/SNF-related matrix-associated actin-dependent regulator of chromatin subfamily A3